MSLLPEPTEQQFEAARTLGVSLLITDAPLTMARMVELVLELQKRVEALERRRSRWGGS